HHPGRRGAPRWRAAVAAAAAAVVIVVLGALVATGAWAPGGGPGGDQVGGTGRTATGPTTGPRARPDGSPTSGVGTGSRPGSRARSGSPDGSASSGPPATSVPPRATALPASSVPSGSPAPSGSPVLTPSRHVGVASFTFLDRSRSRRLVVDVLYPARSGPPAAATPASTPASPATDQAGLPLPAGAAPGAPPLGGRHPLVVFAPGYDVSPAFYSSLLEGWARAGYVVAAVVFPHTNPSSSPLVPGDLVNQPADVIFVISALVSADETGSGLLRGLLDPLAVGVAGHSDGAETMAAVAYASCCRDVRVRAAVIMAGAEIPMSRGGYFPPGSPPLLVVQGTADRPYVKALDAKLYAADGGPKYLLRLLGGTHTSPVHGPGPDLSVVEATTVDFFDAELAGRAGASARLRSDGNRPGVSTLTAAHLSP
ncbi:MAG: hypothetical protein ACRD0J_09940, partial [Acidimicrobiales bacterium]